MTIDIISYTDAQMAALSNEQLMEVRRAQEKKDRIYEKLQEELRASDAEAIDKGMFHSTLREQRRKKLETDYEKEVERLRDGLLFFLRYSYRPGAAGVGYEVDYSLSDAERVEVVKNYYDTTYTDALERLNAFNEDEVARQYLGEYYAPLYYYFYDATKL